MRSRTGFTTLCFTLALTGCGADATTATTGAPSPAAASTADTSPAVALVRDAQHAFRAPVAPEISTMLGLDAHAEPPLGAGTIASMNVDGDALRLAFVEGAVGRDVANVRLAATASGSSRIEDRASGLAADVRLAGANDAPAELADGFVVHRGAIRGADVVRRFQRNGVEDFARFDRAPDVEEMTYHVDVSERVAGLRLVENTLELLDASGDPRLRVSAPYVIGSNGQRYAATLTVRGCSYDTNPAAPWDRAVTAPGARSCDVTVGWANVGVTYPALVDPQWSSTAGGMVYSRTGHRATTVNVAPMGAAASYRVLVAGGYNAQLGVLKTAELFNPATSTWASTASMSVARAYHAMNSSDETLQSGIFSQVAPTRVLASGGFGVNYTPITSAERYDADATIAKWTTVTPMNAPRAAHGAVGLSALTIFVAGGYGAGGTVNATSETCDPGTNTWTTSSTNMSTPRADFTLTGFRSVMTLGFGGNPPTFVPARILAAGGKNTSAATAPGTVATSVDQFEVKSSGNVWTGLKGALRYPVYGHTATASTRADGTSVLVVAGGMDATSHALRIVQEVNKDTMASVSFVYPMLTDRQYHLAFALPSSRILFIGGYSNVIGPQYLGDAETYDVGTGTPVGARTPIGGFGRAQAATAWLPNGAALVAGGFYVNASNVTVTLADSFVYTP